MTICGVIMAGGSGTRLWPLSRAAHPKQFLALNGDDTMLQKTAKRLDDLDVESLITICNEEHRFFVAEQLRQTGQSGTVLLEPVGRNTAPAIALAALTVQDDPLLLVMAADHVIEDQAAFVGAVSSAITLAEAGKLVAFGIVPQRPHTGYGYIKRGEGFTVGFKVDEFVEKPSISVAENYLSSGDYYWNSGIFLFRASRYLEELEKFRPDIFKACAEAMSGTQQDLDFLRVNAKAFEKCAAESIDYAVMEKTLDSVVVPMDVGWSDIGSWESLWDISEKDSKGNVSVGDVMLHNASNSYVRTDGKLVAAIGVDELIIVSTKDALMVAHKDALQDIKIITQRLRNDSRSECQLHQEVCRPWGKFDAIGSGDRYQVKKITVKPGAKLSVQMHYHRAEHWVVVSGTAKDTNGDKIFMLYENESTYIPVGVIHTLENPGKFDLELIEVQSGSYLGEDDIVRFNDKYGRI